MLQDNLHNLHILLMFVLFVQQDVAHASARNMQTKTTKGGCSTKIRNLAFCYLPVNIFVRLIAGSSR